ncbi:MAG TPA: zf-TFIIB domain-containing protein, partial [Polyangiaceae bacterium]|nr:zf-TFIIB domain-containing protein [Polyangiaceae bacterium]
MMYGPSEHACPRCREQLYVGQASGVTLHGCGRCGGVWLGSACARRIAEALPGDAIELDARGGGARAGHRRGAKGARDRGERGDL